MLRRVKENRCLITTIYRRQKNWIGHLLRGEVLLRDVMEGRTMGKRPSGRPRAGIMDELMEGPYVKMKRKAVLKSVVASFLTPFRKNSL